MSAHEEERMVRALEGGMTSEEKEAFFAEHPELREKFEELSQIRDVLHDTGVEERETVAVAQAGTTERDRRAVAEALRARAGSAPAAVAPVRGRPRSMLWLAAAAVVLAVGLGALLLREKPPSDGTLGAQPPECVAPAGDVKEWSAFEFQADPKSAAKFKVFVHEADAKGDRGMLLLDSDYLTERRWQPTATELSKLGKAIVWYVEAYDRMNTRVARSRELPARLRSP